MNPTPRWLYPPSPPTCPLYCPLGHCLPTSRVSGLRGWALEPDCPHRLPAQPPIHCEDNLRGAPTLSVPRLPHCSIAVIKTHPLPRALVQIKWAKDRKALRTMPVQLFLTHAKRCSIIPPGLPCGAVVKNPPANAGDTCSSPGPGRSHMPRSN